ncbi:MAG TPA: alpha/beta hydrolase [Gaiellales bacterium]|nr:alpha/beta hydrolase [Gaiellales bacterium]
MTDSAGIHELGDRDGFAVVFHNGTPTSGLMPEWWDAPARERGLRMIGIDRPGYGDAPAVPGRSLRSVAELTGALMDELGVDRFALLGVSGGGPYALACAAFLPDGRVPAVISAAAGSGFDEVLDGGSMEPEELALHREQAVRPTPEGRGTLARFYDPAIEEMRRADLDGFMRSVGQDPAQSTAEGREVAAYVLESIKDGIRPGRDGWLDDGLTMVRPWGFDPSDIRQPVAVWHSQDDPMVSIEHGRRLLAAIPNSEPILVDGLGHGGVCYRQEVPMMDWIATTTS